MKSTPKTAILQVSDTGPLESLVVMLRSVGYTCYLPDKHLKDTLRRLGCDTVLDIDDLVNHMGYDRPMSLPEISTDGMDRADLYVDIKAHRNGPKVWTRYPNLKKRTLWYRINGGRPEHVINTRGDHGDEVNPPCPVLTPNQWYRHCLDCTNYGTDYGLRDCPRCDGTGVAKDTYACWPPFYRVDEFHQRTTGEYEPPLCLIHNIVGWGYGRLVTPLREMGVRLYGAGSPDGLITHHTALQKLKSTLAMVHLKSNDAPGYALYEALAAQCPIVCTRRLIWRCKMESLLIPNETCLVFDRETHDGLSDQDVLECTQEVRAHLKRLEDPIENQRIGSNGRKQLLKVMWSESNPAHVRSLVSFLQNHFGG